MKKRKVMMAVQEPKVLKADPDEVCKVVLTRYVVNQSLVVICIDKHDNGRYLIIEPELPQTAKELYESIMDYIYTRFELIRGVEDLRLAINTSVKELKIRRDLWERHKDSVWYYVRRNFGYGVLETLIQDPDIEDIELNDWRKEITVVHRRFPQFEALITNIKLSSEDEAKALIEKLALKAGKGISLARPVLHAALPEGYRLAATLGPPASTSPSFDIRKFPEKPFDIVTLIKSGMLSEEVAALAWLLNDSKMFYVISGGSGTGKTTLLNAFLQLTNPNWKIIVVQDIPELQLPGRVRFIQFFGEDSEQQFERCVAALRYRPDMLVVGEVRGREITALVRAIASGSGSATTFHSSSPQEYEMAVRNLLPRDLYVMLSINTAVLFQVARVREGGKVIRKVISIYEKFNGEWRPIYSYGSLRLDNILRRVSSRLLIDDPYEEFENRVRILKSASEGYENVERLMRRFYGRGS